MEIDPYQSNQNHNGKISKAVPAKFKIHCTYYILLYGYQQYTSFLCLLCLSIKDPILDSENWTHSNRLSRRVSNENRACSISNRFFKTRDPRVGGSFVLCSHNPILGINKNWILEIELFEQAFSLLF